MLLSAGSPRSMRDPEVRRERRAMLQMAHVAPLTNYASGLRARGNIEVPDFDPLDAGIFARALFLLEKPGPMTSQEGKRSGSGFISRDNDDPSAEATFNFMRQAGIPRKLIAIWNVIPWWNGTVRVTRDELREGVACIKDVIALMPDLRAVLMVGRKAELAKPYLIGSSLELFHSDHPSPKNRAMIPERWAAIPQKWAKVLEVIA